MTSSTAYNTIGPFATTPKKAGEQKTSHTKRWSRRVAADIVAMFDSIAVVLGALVPATIYGTYSIGVTNWPLFIQSAIAAAIITHLCLRAWNMFDTAKMHDFPQQPARLFAGLGIGICGVAGFGLPHAIQGVHLLVWSATWLSASFFLIVISRATVNVVLAQFTAAGRFHQRVAVFGAGEIARRVRTYLSNPELSITLAGIYDDREDEDRLDGTGQHVSGNLKDLIAAAQSEEIDQIIVALPQNAENRITEITRQLAYLPVDVHAVTHIASDLLSNGVQHTVSNLGPVGLLGVKAKPLSDWAPLVKKLEDRILGTAILLISLPLFPLIALAIKLDSSGPVFFKQRRCGLKKHEFEVIKFRTMTVLENGAHVEQAKKGDTRVTRVGRILRRTSLDELPQLINVLKGEMSLVGPRPHALVHDEKFSEMLEQYANRHQVKPGITGLAQVQGYRGATPTPCKVEARVAADMDYIRNWSLSLDLKILVRTVRAVIKGENAH